jgi:UDP-2,3-diacylglucosamine pyrophosphatase LpxH
VAAGYAIQPPSSPARLTIVVSDLHMGVGRTPEGAWHPFEDFRWSPEFAAFLDAVGQDGAGAVDLVLNGDTFELLQAISGPCRTEAVGCAEEEMLARLERVLDAHAADIKALGRFAAAGSNRITFVPGDHDAALLFPRLARRVVDAVAAPSGRVEVATSGNWVSRDGRIVAEHGHQIGLSVRRLENWPTPFARFEEREVVGNAAGQVVVQNLVNQLEERYPIVDNMAASGTGIKYAIAAGDGIDARVVAPLLRSILLMMPWQQFRMELDDGEVEPPVWDLAQVRQQGAAFFAAAVPDDDPFKPLVKQAPPSGLLEQWTDEEIGAVCDYRAAVRRARRRFEPAVTQFAPRGPAVTECPRTPETRGARFDYFWQSRDRIFARHLQTLRRPAESSANPVAVLVHAHTHLPDRSQTGANMISGGLLKIPMEGFSPVRGALTPIVINGGAWQRTITPVQYERIRAERSLSDAQLLRVLQPEDLASCYSFVRIPPYVDAPSPVVRYWRETGGSWGFGSSCS